MIRSAVDLLESTVDAHSRVKTVHLRSVLSVSNFKDRISLPSISSNTD